MTFAASPRVRSSVSFLHGQLFSLQSKLVVAMTLLIVLSVVAAGTVLVLRSRDDRRQQALERLAAAAPGIYQAAPIDVMAGKPGEPGDVSSLTTSVDSAAYKQGVRVLLVGAEGRVLHDTEGGLTGVTVAYPSAGPGDAQRGFSSWRTSYGSSDITFVGSAAPVPLPGRGAGDTTFTTEVAPFSLPVARFGPEERVGMLLAARSETIENAWMSALPGVGIAAGIATPFAVIVAVFLARQIARPVHQLTLASEAMARGDFDQRVEVEREDEVGRLAKAFSVMAQRVGERDAQMRSLIANVSHDLKTPMSSILGYSQALRDGVTDDHTRVADVINAQAQHAARLLDDLLFLSEVDAGQVLGQLDDVPAAGVITPAVALLEHRAEEQGVAIAMNVAESLVLRGVDRDRVVRALANVLDNAIRFASPESSVTVRAFAEGEASVIAVANDGPHIPEDELPHIFERFHRGSADASGHGLGLAIAKEAVVISNGAIEAANTPTGVEVRLRFPA